MKVYLPSWNGDMRLTAAAGGNFSVLILEKPTPQERVLVGEFLRAASKKGWWKGETPAKDEPYEGRSMEISVAAPIAKASKVLVSIARPKDRTLTAVKFSSGRMEVVEGAYSKSLDAIEALIGLAKEEEDLEDSRKMAAVGSAPKEDVPKKKTEAAAASVKRPTPCCPQCIPGAIEPATEVLLSFLTPEQHEQWARERAILVEGHLSGHRYIIAHRHSEIAQRVGRICSDVDDEVVVHFHDWSVPPEEEVLAAKLIMEHAEPWLRNEATVLGEGTDVYPNPFGDRMDGTESSGFAMGVGQALRLFMK